MNGEELIDRVLITVDDADLDTDIILSLLNEGLRVLAAAVSLPDLETSDIVETVADEFTAALPEDFHHGLFDCQEQDEYNPDRVLNSKRQMLAKYGRLNQTGTVRHVCREGQTMLYQPIPDEVRALLISYFRVPTPITERTSPDCLPEETHKALFHYAAEQLFDDIEDGMEGAKVNTLRHGGRFEKIKAELKIFYKDAQSHPAPPVIKGEFL